MNDSATIDLSTFEERMRDAARIDRPPAPPVLLDYDEIIAQAQHLVAQRAKVYDVDGLGVVEHFETVAKLASLKLGHEITPYVVLIVMESLKDVRRASNPKLIDSHLDGINYRAFAAQFAIAEAVG